MVETGPLLETVAKQISRRARSAPVVMMVEKSCAYEAAYAFRLLRTAGRNVWRIAAGNSGATQAESRTLADLFRRQRFLDLSRAWGHGIGA